jgi:Ser/Thr protein kinase RdoA (MazF antagonist)
MIDPTITPSAVLAQAYRLQESTLSPLVVTPSKQVYRVERAQTPMYILRAYAVATGVDQQHVQAQARLLNLLEANHFPAERLVRTVDAAPLFSDQAWHYLLTTYVHGQTPPYRPAALRKIGAALGQLHALAATGRQPDISLPLAAMRPAPELTYALRRLQEVAEEVPATMRTRYETLIRAIQALDRCEDLPKVLIHNDCHPANAVVTPSGAVTFIDWEGAGWGTGVIDVGFLLSSCDTRSPWTPQLRPNPNRVRAIIDGYCQHHILTTPELDRLVDAMRFRALVYGAGSFATAVCLGKPEEESPWWWRRYVAAEEIAARAQQHFKQYQ